MAVTSDFSLLRVEPARYFDAEKGCQKSNGLVHTQQELMTELNELISELNTDPIRVEAFTKLVFELYTHCEMFSIFSTEEELQQLQQSLSNVFCEFKNCRIEHLPMYKLALGACIKNLEHDSAGLFQELQILLNEFTLISTNSFDGYRELQYSHLEDLIRHELSLQSDWQYSPKTEEKIFKYLRQQLYPRQRTKYTELTPKEFKVAQTVSLLLKSLKSSPFFLLSYASSLRHEYEEHLTAEIIERNKMANSDKIQTRLNHEVGEPASKSSSMESLDDTTFFDEEGGMECCGSLCSFSGSSSATNSTSISSASISSKKAPSVRDEENFFIPENTRVNSDTSAFDDEKSEEITIKSTSNRADIDSISSNSACSFGMDNDEGINPRHSILFEIELKKTEAANCLFLLVERMTQLSISFTPGVKKGVMSSVSSLSDVQESWHSLLRCNALELEQEGLSWDLSNERLEVVASLMFGINNIEDFAHFFEQNIFSREQFKRICAEKTLIQNVVYLIITIHPFLKQELIDKLKGERQSKSLKLLAGFLVGDKEIFFALMESLNESDIGIIDVENLHIKDIFELEGRKCLDFMTVEQKKILLKRAIQQKEQLLINILMIELNGKAKVTLMGESIKVSLISGGLVESLLIFMRHQIKL